MWRFMHGYSAHAVSTLKDRDTLSWSFLLLSNHTCIKVKDTVKDPYKYRYGEVGYRG